MGDRSRLVNGAQVGGGHEVFYVVFPPLWNKAQKLQTVTQVVMYRSSRIL